MIDHVSPADRSEMMRAVRVKNTAPELEVRKLLHAAGFRFRLHRKDLPGRPDIVLPRFKMAVFVHGCFWHGHNCRRGRRPSTNAGFWSKKIEGNIARDARTQKALTDKGWCTTVIWTCQLKTDTQKLIEKLSRRKTLQTKHLN